MNTRRIPIALFILLGVCAALAYAVGSIRPFAPGAKFSNLPPPAAATQVVATNVNATAAITTKAVALQAPSDVATRPAKTVAVRLPSASATRAADTVAPRIPSASATRAPNTVAPKLPSATVTRAPNTVAPRIRSATVTRAANTVAPRIRSATATRVLKEATSLKASDTPTRLAQAVSHPSLTNTPLPSLTPLARVTHIAQATVPPTATAVSDAQGGEATPTALPVTETAIFVATQTSIPAQQTWSAVATRAFATPVAKKPNPARAISNTTNFLLIGTDARTVDPTWVPNTDVIMVLFLDTANQRAALLSFPRDLLVAIPGHQAFRINSAFHHGWLSDGVEGGVNVLKQVLRDDFDIRIDHWALIDFDGLSRIIDTLGGIEVNVPCALSDTIDEQAFTIPAGNVQMDYLTAKRYVQSRYTTSDTSRNHRQQRVVWAMAKKALGMNAPDRVPLLYETLHENVATDMTLFSMIGLVPAVYQLDLQNHPERLRARVLEAPAVYPWVSTSGAWLYMPNYDLIQKQLDEIFQAPQVALNEIIPAECPRVPATPHPTDLPPATPSDGTTPTTDANVTPTAEATAGEVSTGTPVPDAAPTETSTDAVEMTQTPTNDSTPTDVPAETATAAPTEPPTQMPDGTEIPAAEATATP